MQRGTEPGLVSARYLQNPTTMLANSFVWIRQLHLKSRSCVCRVLKRPAQCPSWTERYIELWNVISKHFNCRNKITIGVSYKKNNNKMYAAKHFLSFIIKSYQKHRIFNTYKNSNPKYKHQTCPCRRCRCVHKHCNKSQCSHCLRWSPG